MGVNKNSFRQAVQKSTSHLTGISLFLRGYWRGVGGGEYLLLLHSSSLNRGKAMSKIHIFLWTRTHTC